MLAGFHKPAADRPDWAQRLHEFVDAVRARALGPDPIRFSKPEIILVGEHGSKTRLIALFPLGDRIIDKLVSKYLRVRFDALLSDSAFAYRAARPTQAHPTHHDIIRRIEALCSQDRDRDRWIAGSDIRKCFDCFPHSLALAAFRAASRTVFALGASIDSRAARSYSAYFDCYDYRSVIHDSTDPELCEFRTRTETAWPINELRGLHGSNFDCERIGVPQGMALSMLTSNLLLSAVDFQVVDFCREHRISTHYFRYSDDARFICERADECQTVFDVFVAATSRLKLPVHPPSDERSADAKTSRPRPWTEDNSGTFVGYEVWPNGQVCVRGSSVRKHRAKRWKLIATIIAHAKQYPLRTSPEQLLKSVGERLMRMSIPGSVDSDFCWAAGFWVARGSGREVEALARNLDRMHGSQMAALRRALEEIFGRKISKSHVPRHRNFRTYFECFRRPHRSPTPTGNAIKLIKYEHENLEIPHG